MPSTAPWNLWYPSSTDPLTPLEGLFSASALSMNVALTSLNSGAIPRVANAAGRTTVFPTPAIGNRVYRIDTGIVERYDGTAWKNWESPWISYTTTLSVASGTANWVGSTGTRDAQYKYISGRLQVRVKFTFGGTISTFAGAQFSLPVVGENFFVVNQLGNGQVTLADVGTSIYNGFVRYVSSSVMGIIFQTNAGAIGSISNINPATWVSGDFIYVDFVYDPA